MDLSRKLARLAQPPPPVEEKEHRLDRVRRMLDAMIEKQRRAEALTRGRVLGGPVIGGPAAISFAREPEPDPSYVGRRYGERLPGERRETEHGAVYVSEQMLAPDHCHGRARIARALLQRAEIFAALALDPSLATVDPRRMLLLDTETTGLSGGTGTIPFLIGLAWFEDESLVIEQLLLASPGEEEPMLRIVAERLERSSCLVTYNGKTFDWPLLSTRLVLHRIPPPRLPPHFDLLHAVRRIYKRRLRESRLVKIEEELLGMRRERDIDGFEIPALYWKFVREGDGGRLAPVLEHNANDLVALAALLGVIAEGFERVAKADDPLDHLGRARVALRAGDRTRAYEFALASASGGADDQSTAEALSIAARIAAKSGAFEKAREHFLLALEHAPSAELHLALAKLCEHRLKDHRQATEHALEAREAEGPEANDRRLGRLKKRARKRA